MARRIVSVALWAYFGWYLTAFLAAYAGMPIIIAPLGGALMATAALLDWRNVLPRHAGDSSYETQTISE